MLADSGCIFIPVCNYYMQNKFGRSSRNANTSPDSPLFLYMSSKKIHLVPLKQMIW